MERRLVTKTKRGLNTRIVIAERLTADEEQLCAAAPSAAAALHGGKKPRGHRDAGTRTNHNNKPFSLQYELESMSARQLETLRKMIEQRQDRGRAADGRSRRSRGGGGGGDAENDDEDADAGDADANQGADPSSRAQPRRRSPLIGEDCGEDDDIADERADGPRYGAGGPHRRRRRRSPRESPRERASVRHRPYHLSHRPRPPPPHHHHHHPHQHRPRAGEERDERRFEREEDRGRPDSAVSLPLGPECTAESLGLCPHAEDLREPAGAAGGPSGAGGRILLTHEEILTTDYLLKYRRLFDAAGKAALDEAVADRAFSILNAPSLHAALALADETLSYIKYHDVHGLPINPADPYFGTVSALKFALFNKLNSLDLRCVLEDTPANRNEQVFRLLANKPVLGDTCGTTYELQRKAPSFFVNGLHRAMLYLVSFARVVGGIKRRRALHNARGPHYVRDLDDNDAVGSYSCGMITDLVLGHLREHVCDSVSCQGKIARALRPYALTLNFCPFNDLEPRDAATVGGGQPSLAAAPSPTVAAVRSRAPELTAATVGAFPPSGAHLAPRDGPLCLYPETPGQQRQVLLAPRACAASDIRRHRSPLNRDLAVTPVPEPEGYAFMDGSGTYVTPSPGCASHSSSPGGALCDPRLLFGAHRRWAEPQADPSALVGGPSPPAITIETATTGGVLPFHAQPFGDRAPETESPCGMDYTATDA